MNKKNLVIKNAQLPEKQKKIGKIVIFSDRGRGP